MNYINIIRIIWILLEKVITVSKFASNVVEWRFTGAEKKY